MNQTRTVQHVAIVGLGSIGRRHLRLLKQLRPDIEVTLVRSGHGQPSPEEGLAQSCVRVLTDAIELGIDAAIISSPAPWHIPQALELVQADVPILVEKPLSHDLIGVEELKQLATDRQSTVLVGYVLRHDLAAHHFQSLLISGCPGQLLHARIECGSYLPDWRPEQDFRQSASAQPDLGGGALLELSHELDYARWFFGPVKQVRAVLTNSGTLGLPVEDTVDLILTMASERPVTVHLDFCRRQPSRCCFAQGTCGELAWDAIQNRVIWRPVAAPAETWEYPVDRDAMYRVQLQHFMDCIEQGAEPAVSLRDGIEVLKLIEAARRANAREETVYL